MFHNVVHDGIITNDKFCCTRYLHLRLRASHRPQPACNNSFQAVGQANKEIMKNSFWTVLHHQVPRTDAQRRWDQAYQLLLQLAGPSICTTEQEKPVQNRSLCAGLDEPPSPSQTIEQQLTRLRSLAEQQLDTLSEHIYRDDGFSGASLNRPGLNSLRDTAAQAAFDAVLITAPDQLARKYVHQVLLDRGTGRARLGAL